MTLKAGLIGFARTTGVMGRLIRVGEWLKFRRSEFNHVFVIDRVENGVAYVLQATMRGVTNTATLDDIAPGGSYWLLTVPKETDVVKMLRFGRAQIGERYGFLTVAAIALDILSWSWVPSFRGARKASWECAALTGEMLRFGGWLYNWRDVYDVMPQELFDVLVPQSTVVTPG